MADSQGAETADRTRRSWDDAVRMLKSQRSLTMAGLGFSAGLPLLLIFGTLSVWLREAGVERATVTFFSWAALGYSFKFVWAPLVDRIPIPMLTARLGRRRGWLLAAQLAVVASLLWTASFDPATTLTMTAIGAVMIGFSAATQDIVIDAYRIESAPPDEQSMLASMYIAGYRIGMLVAGAGALWLAARLGDGAYDYDAWASAYRLMAVMMAVGVGTTLLSPEPAMPEGGSRTFSGVGANLRFLTTFVLAACAFVLVFVASADVAVTAKQWLGSAMKANVAGFAVETTRLGAGVTSAALAAWLAVRSGLVPPSHIVVTYVAPVIDFTARYGRLAILILVLIGTYRIADIVMGAIANVFYLDAGYSKTQIATYSKFWGLWATIAGGVVGGVLALRHGVYRVLLLGAALAAASNLLFAYLAGQAPSAVALASVIVADNLSGGLAGAAFVAYLSSLTSISFTAMQYALFTSVMTLFPKLLAGYSGTMVDAVGYQTFFVITAVLGVPVLGLIWLAGRLVPIASTAAPETKAATPDPM